jgi:hypothetical protein
VVTIAWAEATISIASEPVGYQGFFFNSSGLQYNNSVGGWIGKFFPNGSVGSGSDCLKACDWWLPDAPQLFNVAGYTSNISLPTSCSRVQVLPVAV